MSYSTAILDMSATRQVHKAFDELQYIGAMEKNADSPRGKPFAMKICEKKGSKDKLDCLDQEMGANLVLMGLPHPNVLKPIDVWDTKTHTYLVTKLARGQYHPF